jgi:hypothetical protein
VYFLVASLLTLVASFLACIGTPGPHVLALVAFFIFYLSMMQTSTLLSVHQTITLGGSTGGRAPKNPRFK